MLCVHCGSPAESLVKRFGPTNYSLSECLACGKLADPYLETGFLIKLIDLLLLKQAVFRHLLFNLEDSSTSRLPLVVRLLGCTLLLDAYTRWTEEIAINVAPLSDADLLQRFLACLLRQCFETLVTYLLLVTFCFGYCKLTRVKTQFHTKRVVLALAYSSLAKQFVLFVLLIWRSEYAASDSIALPTAVLKYLTPFMSLDQKLDRVWVVRRMLSTASAVVGISVILQARLPITALILLPPWLLSQAIINRT